MDGPIDGEVDVLELERLGAGFGCSGVGVFGWSEQPEEANDDEVAGDGIEDAPLGVVKVKGVVEAERMASPAGL